MLFGRVFTKEECEAYTVKQIAINNFKLHWYAGYCMDMRLRLAEQNFGQFVYIKLFM